jgi:hypothetical protein
VAYKIFTNGSVLQASEINDNLMKQAVAVFSNSAARSAAITSPVEGQLTYLEDANVYNSWNGSSWVSPFIGGSTLVGSSSFTAQSTVVLTNSFTSEYQNYAVYANFVMSGVGLGIVRFSSGGAVDSSTNYVTAYDIGGTVGSETTTALNTFGSSPASGGTLAFQALVFNPFASLRTDVISTSIARNPTGTTAPIWTQTAAYYAQNTSFDGISITASSGTMTGSFRVYGLRNA